MKNDPIRILGSAPVISNLTPPTGAQGGNYEVRITGEGFVDGETSVTFGGLAATGVTVESSTVLTAMVPPAASAGPVQVIVRTTSSGASQPATFTYLSVGILTVQGGDFTATGLYGGSLNPSSHRWLLRNSGQQAIEFTVSSDADFIDVTETQLDTPVTLAAGQSRFITATLNNAARSLPAGTNTGKLTFTGGVAEVTQNIRVIVIPAPTQVSLSVTPVVSNYTEPVTMVAKVTSPHQPTGTIQFVGGLRTLGTVDLDASGTAELQVSDLAVGRHAIRAVYSGDDRHSPAESSVIFREVLPLGSVIIRQETDGADGVFGFDSTTPALRLSIPTSGGQGESAPIEIPGGSYSITADDMSAAGFALTGLSCSDSDSSTDLETRTASIVLDPGEAVICTFTSINSRGKTSALIEDFLSTRAGLILANQPDAQRRIDRLNRGGGGGAGADPTSTLLGYLPGIVQGGPVAGAISLGAIDQLAGKEQSRFDLWLEGTFALFDSGGPQGHFALASVGADYLVTPDLLLGGFVQIDHMAQSSPIDPATIEGTGWVAGPYVTARLGDNLYLDVLAGAGLSANQVSPYGTYTDSFDATRWLVDASLQGQWSWENWTLSPRASVRYFEETSAAYTDSLGVGIPAMTVGLGQLAVGPGISYRYTSDGDVVIDTGLRVEGVADFLNTPSSFGLAELHGRVEGSVDFTFARGASLGVTLGHDGIGSAASSTSASAGLRVPLN